MQFRWCVCWEFSRAMRTEKNKIKRFQCRFSSWIHDGNRMQISVPIQARSLYLNAQYMSGPIYFKKIKYQNPQNPQRFQIKLFAKVKKLCPAKFNCHCHFWKTFKLSPIFFSKNFPWNQRWGKQKNKEACMIIVWAADEKKL